MLTLPLLRARVTSQICERVSAANVRTFVNGNNGKESSDNLRPRRSSKQNGDSQGMGVAPGELESKNEGPSLYEQLFPDQLEDAKQQETEPPLVPREPFSVPEENWEPGRWNSSRVTAMRKHQDRTRVRSAQNLRETMIAQAPQTSVLVLRNASKNLVEEDFRRLIPQGKRLEGWRLEQGDILRVIPGRDLDTLSQQSYYFLLFSSPLSAFTYQGHVTRIHRMVASYAPASVLSSIPPSPGYMAEGMDVHAAIEAYTLTPPTQSLNLRQLKPPLAPIIESIVRNGGYPALKKRKERMPYEARLTLDGPQLHLSAVRHIFLTSAKDRRLPWSGGDDLAPRLTKWEPPAPRELPSPMSKNTDARRYTVAQKTNTAEEIPEANTEEVDRRQENERKRRNAHPVYILGFHTEGALQSFVHSWHRRPLKMETEESDAEHAELPPVANIEVLW